MMTDDDRDLLRASRSNSTDDLVGGHRGGDRTFDYTPSHTAHGTHSSSAEGSSIQSMDFDEMESSVWRVHQCRRFFQDTGHWWTASRRTTAWKWVLVIILGVVIACIGYFVKYLTAAMQDYKFEIVNGFVATNTVDGSARAYFALVAISVFYALLAGVLCAFEPAAAGSGIPEIKAYLNGIDLNNVVRMRVLVAKVLGMCFSCASGLPLGKEGPMIHAGSIIGAAVSQGKTIALGFDTSWSKFQDLRNDRSKRDFVTFGAAAGVAAAFSAPIGGILFTLEEGASFWSTTLTFRAFFCAMVTELTVNLINSGFTLGVDTPQSMFDFGKFDAFRGYATFELVVFALIGCLGGVVGAFFNYINKRATVFRSKHVNTHIWKRLLELVLLTAGWATVSYVLPKMYSVCTPIPSPDTKMSAQQLTLLSKLQQFTCDKGFFNQLATLYLTDADTAMQQLFHFSEVDGTPYTSFEVGSLILFFLPYFFFAAATSGVLCPAGLFVPTLLAGATLGRLIGHLLNSASPGGVTDSGTYALIGAAAVLGGMSRMTIAGAVILLEATNKNEYLLPLMLTFAAARYSGNAINQPMYDMQIDLKNLPFLEGSLRTLGLLNYHPITAVMARPVLTINEVNRVGFVYQLLLTTSHNGFPVVNKEGRLRGLILRKTLCTILKLRAFSEASPAPGAAPGTVQLTTAATIFHDTIERNYPNYPSIEGVQVDKEDLNLWLDVRPYMDSAPYSLNESSSIQRCYRLFRSMGLRHLVVLDEQHRVTGMVTRKDISEHRLAREWAANGAEIQKYLNVNRVDPALVLEADSVPGRGGPADALNPKQLSAALSKLEKQSSSSSSSSSSPSSASSSTGTSVHSQNDDRAALPSSSSSSSSSLALSEHALASKARSLAASASASASAGAGAGAGAAGGGGAQLLLSSVELSGPPPAFGGYEKFEPSRPPAPHQLGLGQGAGLGDHIPSSSAAVSGQGGGLGALGPMPMVASSSPERSSAVALAAQRERERERAVNKEPKSKFR